MIAGLKIKWFIGVMIPFLSASSCGNENEASLPEIETLNAFSITQTTAECGGIITSDGGSEITEKGICWGTGNNPDLSGQFISAGSGSQPFETSLTGLAQNTEYTIRAFATNDAGTSYGNPLKFKTLAVGQKSQIIADHSVVDRFDKIPQQYIDEVKKMWLVYAGESHARAIRVGLLLLEGLYPKYAVSVVESGTPEPYTTANLRASTGTRGDYDYPDRWRYQYGEEDWFTNSLGISRTKAGITYCNSNNLEIAAIGFGWCYDDTYNIQSPSIDPEFGCHWFGRSVNGPDGSTCWGLNADDYAITGNRVSMDTYLSATQEYINYCLEKGYRTRVFFTTGPVEPTYYVGERGYQGSIKHQYIREYVKKDPERVLFDYADILCYDNDGKLSTSSWNGHTFPVITPANYGDASIGHIGEQGAIRLAKAMWWMLARMAGWDGN